METFVRGRGRALRRQQPDPVRDRVVPPRRFSNGAARGCRGTGVFLPRVTAVSPETKKKPGKLFLISPLKPFFSGFSLLY